MVSGLIECCEMLGFLPSSLQSCVSVLIPKHKQGDVKRTAFRGVGVLPYLYRLWTKCRQPLVWQWESEHPSAQLAHQKGRSIQEQVFEQGAAAEYHQVTSKGQGSSAAVLFDLSNFYEHLDRPRLMEAARRLHFPVLALILALNQYGSLRVVMLQDLAILADYHRRGCQQAAA